MIPNYQENIGLVHLVAKRCAGWVMALEIPLDYEDVFQDVSLAFVYASRMYNPDNENGVKFSSYFTQAAFHQLKRTVGSMTGVKRMTGRERDKLKRIKEENIILQSKGMKQKSTFVGLRVINIEDMKVTTDDADGGNLVDFFPSDFKTPEQIIIEQQEWDSVLSRLSPLAKKIAKMIESPSDDLLREVKAQHAHDKMKVKYSVKRGGESTVTLQSASSFLSKVAGYSDLDLRKAEKELLNAAAKLY